ncbi:MAG: ABC transporter substrate-binding protein [Bacteroidota bacterium]
MKKIAYYFPLLLLILTSCGGTEEPQQKDAIGGKMYGGTFKFLSPEKINSLFPAETGDVYSQRVVSQLFESLLRIDGENMDVVPCIAESYMESNDAKTFTFKIRKGIKFHEDDCFSGGARELNAKDVKFALEFSCSGLPNNTYSYLLVDKIEGAKQFNKISKSSLPKTGVSGIVVKGDYELEIKLITPSTDFAKILTHSGLGIFPAEAYEKYGKEIGKHPVGTGPFILTSHDNNGIVLNRNLSYWRKDELGNQLPFLHQIDINYVKDKKSELMAFRKKEIDMVLEIPVEEIENVFGSLQEAQEGKNVKHNVVATASMNIHYVAFACESAEFKDVRVRKAFNIALNRNDIVNKNLLGEGWPALNGFVPKLQNYSAEKVKGHSFDVQLAQQLMTQAGYPGGKNFPVLDFYVNAAKGSASYKMCEGVVRQLKENLGVTLNIKMCTYDEKEAAITSGTAKIWRAAWIADYPDAVNFLSIFYGKNIPTNSNTVNPYKFRSQEFDLTLEKALKETNDAKRNDYMVKCDQILVNEAPVMPILTEDFLAMTNARVRDFTINAMETLDFSKIYIKEMRK